MRYIQQAEEQEYKEVQAFYGTLIDNMEHARFHPGWKKGIYPEDSFLKESLQRQELYVMKQEQKIIAAMVLNHQCNEGYQDVSWQVHAEENEITVIHALGVLPEFHGQGAAGEMVQQAICIAKEHLQKAVRLDVLAGNVPACKLYERFGFQFRKTVCMFYEDTGWTDYLLYELPLV